MEVISMDIWQMVLSLVAAFGGFLSFLFFEHSRIMNSLESKHREIMDRIDRKVSEHIDKDHTPKGWCEGRFFPANRGEIIEKDLRRLQSQFGFLRARALLKREFSSQKRRSGDK